MEVSQIIELMKAVSENGLTDFSYEENGVTLKIRKHPEKKMLPPHSFAAPTMPPVGAAPMQYAASSIPAGYNSEVITTQPEEDNQTDVISGQIVKSPLVGTFYAASSPDTDPFVRVGDTVKKGQVLGIVEAMKLMNEIESDFDGVVKQILVKNGDLIEYDQPLFVIE